jgi:hypothetical protein
LKPAEDAVSCVGSLIVMSETDVHPLPSVIVHVYVPAARLDAVAALPPLGAHEYVYPGFPPTGLAVADPVAVPKHVASVPEIVEVKPPVEGTDTVCTNVHPLASVIVQVYEPVARLDAVAPVPPEGAHE